MTSYPKGTVEVDFGNNGTPTQLHSFEIINVRGANSTNRQVVG